MTLYKHNAEAAGQTSGTAVSAANSAGTGVDTFTAVTGSLIQYSTAQSWSGTQSFNVTSGGTVASYIGYGTSTTGASTSCAVRMYIRFAALPTTNDQSLFKILSTSGGTGLFTVTLNTVGQLALVGDTAGAIGTTTGTALSTNTWYRVECAFTDASTTTGTAEMRVYVGDSTTVQNTYSGTGKNLGNASAMGNCRFGRTLATASAYAYFMDDLAFQTGSTTLIGPSAAAPVVQSPNLTGSGTVSQTNQPLATRAAAVSGSGTLTATTSAYVASSSPALTGSGTLSATSAVVNRKIALFTDSFTSSSAWGFTGSAAITGGKLEINPTNAYDRATSVESFDLTNSSVFMEMTGHSTGTGYTDSFVQLQLDANNIISIDIESTVMSVYIRTGGTWSSAFGAVTYNATTMRWLKIAHNGSQVLFSYSSDASTWTQFHAQTVSWALTSLQMNLGGGAEVTPKPTLYFDNVNTVPVTAVTVETALSGSGQLSASPTPIGTRSAAATGSGTLSTSSLAVATRSGQLSGSGTLSKTVAIDGFKETFTDDISVLSVRYGLDHGERLSISAGRLAIASGAAAETSAAGISYTAQNYSLTNSAIFAQMWHTEPSGGSHEMGMFLVKSWVSGDYIQLIAVNGGVVFRVVSGWSAVYDQWVPGSANPSGGESWQRIRHVSGSTIALDRSYDGITWAQKYTTTVPFAIDDLLVAFLMSHWDATDATSATGYVDNVNTTPAAAVVQSPNLSGSGSLSATTTSATALAAAVAGQGNVTATGVPLRNEALNLSGSGALSTTRSSITTGAGLLTGAGTLGHTAQPSVTQAASATGSGTLTATTVGGGANGVNLSGSGTLTSSSTPIAVRASSLSGSGTLTASATPSASGSPALSGSGTLSVTASPSGSRSAALSGSGTLSVTTSTLAIVTANVDLGGVGSLSTTRSVAMTVSRALSGLGALSFSLHARTSVELTGLGTLTKTQQGDFEPEVLLALGITTRSLHGSTSTRSLYGEARTRSLSALIISVEDS